MGIEELWETVFFSTFFPGCFQPHELLLLQTGALAFPILLSDCSCHRLLPVDPTWQTPWEDKLKVLQHTSEDQGAIGWRLNQSHRAVWGRLALLEVGDGGRGVGAHTLAEEG